MKDLTLSEWRRGNRALATAADLIASDPEASASRAFYAAFHGVSALFALRGRQFSKHAAVRAAVHRDLVHTGEWPAELGLAYDQVSDLRENADYGDLKEVSPAAAQEAVDEARRILDFVRQSCPELSAPDR